MPAKSLLYHAYVPMVFICAILSGLYQEDGILLKKVIWTGWSNWVAEVSE